MTGASVRTWRTAGVACIAAMLVGGCGSGPSAVPGLASAQPVEALGQQPFGSSTEASYVLRPADVISITVFREADLSIESLPIAANGEISLPLAGTVQAAGLTQRQLEDRIEATLGQRYLRNPEVAVNVLEYRSHEVTVEGAVRTPGLFTFRPGTRLSGAISLAEGPVREAELKDVAVFRQAPVGIQIAKFDYAAVRAGQMLDPVLQPGDRIVVGTDGLSVFWQDVLRTIPAFAVFFNRI